MIKVINVISDTNIGGAGKCLLNFINGYDKNLLDMEVFIPFDSQLKPELEMRNIKFTEVLGINDKSLNFKSINELRKLFKEKKPDIVHTHAAMSARIAARLTKACKIVHTRHSVFDQPEKLKKFPLKQIRGGINNILSHEIIAVSPAAVVNLVETGTDQGKITVVYNGVSKVSVLLKEDGQRVRKKYSLAESDFVVAIIARLEKVKGHEYVLDAAKILLEKDKNIKILIAGTGALETHLKERVSKENLNNVIFVGFVRDIYEIENIMDLQINTSYGTEATSLSLLEGMSLGKPAVVSDFGGNPFVIKEGVNGLVVAKKDAEKLVSGILELKNNLKLYNKLSIGSEKEFEKEYTVDVMISGITKVYMKLCKI